MIKVLIADDQELIRDSLRIVLSGNPDFSVNTAANGIEVVRAVRRDKPDVILMDIRMPEMDGVQCTQIIKENYPEIKIIILTTFDDDEYIFSALKHGASGYLLKGISADKLIEAIHKVYHGNAMINEDIAGKVVKMFSQLARENAAVITVDEDYIKEITESEWKVIGLVSKGLSNKEIAAELFLTEGSVRNYLSSVLKKLDLRDRTQLAIWAVQWRKS
ncbi:MAG: response regulator transcription factor [Lachnospiraceae bacterium]|jgi:DNA-binding NarL/FixJ family response regulator|nr:response regulator transcription factor [Lachnospiraceae bacterium]NBI91449.1 DNA-binding response regulator [Lachnospiraceae bacterium]